MKTVAVFEAKSRLSEILAAVERGDEYTVTKHGKPIARIVPSGRLDDTSMTDARKLIARIKSSRKDSNLTDDQLREAIEDGRD